MRCFVILLGLLCLLFVPTLLLCQTFVMPGYAQVVVGTQRAFQVLRSDGTQVNDAKWSSDQPDDVEMQMEEGQAKITFKKPGLKAINADIEGRITKAEVTVYAEEDSHHGTIQWWFDALNGRFPTVLHAWYGTTLPSYYYEDRGATRTQIRAITEDGLQLWMWPVPALSEPVRMLCGDTLGGVVAQVGTIESRQLVALDSKGKEAWRISVPGFRGRQAYTSTQNGDFFFVLDDLDGVSGRLLAVNGRDGSLQRTIELPVSRQFLHNFILKDGKLICTPNAEGTKNLPLSRSDLFTDIDGRVHLAISETTMSADGAGCTAGAILSPSQIRLKYSQKLSVMLIPPQGDVIFQVVETKQQEGMAESLVLHTTVPTGDIIPDQTGLGSFIAVRTETKTWPSERALSAQEYQYRVTPEGELKLKVGLPTTPSVLRTTMLLGDENRTGLTSRGDQLIVFSTDSGKELWRWKGSTTRIELLAALANGGVIIRENGKYKEIHADGVKQTFPDEIFLFQEHWRLPSLEER